MRTTFRPRPPCLAALVLTLAVTAACKKENAYVPPPPPQVGVAKPLQQEVTAVSGTHRQRGRLQPGGSRSAGAGLPAGDQLPGRRDGQAGRHAVRHRAGAVSGAAAAGAGDRWRPPRRNWCRPQAEFNRQSTLGKSDFASQSAGRSGAGQARHGQGQDPEQQAGVTIAAINLGYTRVTAPFDGVVTAHLVSVGGLVGVTGPTKLATIVQLDPIYVTFTVSEQDVLRIRAAMAEARHQARRTSQGPVEVGLMTEARLSACRQARLRRADDRSVDRHADRARRFAESRSCAAAGHVPAHPHSVGAARRRPRCWCRTRRSAPTRAGSTCWWSTRTMWCSSAPCRPGNWSASCA